MIKTTTKQQKIQGKKNPNHLDAHWGFTHSTTCASHHRTGRVSETEVFSYHLVFNRTETLMSQDAVIAKSNFHFKWLALILGPGAIKH